MEHEEKGGGDPTHKFLSDGGKDGLEGGRKKKGSFLAPRERGGGGGEKTHFRNFWGGRRRRGRGAALLSPPPPPPRLPEGEADGMGPLPPPPPPLPPIFLAPMALGADSLTHIGGTRGGGERKRKGDGRLGRRISSVYIGPVALQLRSLRRGGGEKGTYPLF